MEFDVGVLVVVRGGMETIEVMETVASGSERMVCRGGLLVGDWRGCFGRGQHLD